MGQTAPCSARSAVREQRAAAVVGPLVARAENEFAEPSGQPSTRATPPQGGTEVKDFFNFYEKPKDPLSFSSVRIGLASPKKILEWSFGEVKKP